MKNNVLHSQILSVLFAAGKPITESELHILASAPEIATAVTQLQKQLAAGHMGIQIEQVGGGWRLVVHPNGLEAVDKVLRPTPPRLSKAALEVLALVAYQQPVTRSELELLRNKSVDGVLDGLIERGFVCSVGHQDTVGRPNTYGTTEQFLHFFGLQTLEELPQMEDNPILLLRG